MNTLDRRELRVLLTERGWERVGPPYETWTHEGIDTGIFQFCEDEPHAGHVFYVNHRSTTRVLTIDHARALLDLRSPGVR